MYSRLYTAHLHPLKNVHGHLGSVKKYVDIVNCYWSFTLAFVAEKTEVTRDFNSFQFYLYGSNYNNSTLSAPYCIVKTAVLERKPQ